MYKNSEKELCRVIGLFKLGNWLLQHCRLCVNVCERRPWVAANHF